MTKEQEKLLKSFEIEIPDGFYKGIVVYHHALRHYIEEILEEKEEK